jgi:DNA (cytosine-5)-methyltransferase 1
MKMQDMLDFGRELVIDNFAGGGGASTGIEAAIGRPIDIAINHDAQALAMHAANHPHTIHLCESVWDVDPIEVTKNQPVGLIWFSPDCKHFSKAKGGKPVEKKIRGLAWVALRWAAKCKPRVIMLENVEEFKTWGRLIADDKGNLKPDPARKGETFRSFVRQLEGHGYKVEFQEIRASDYGAPTIRKRLFMIARRDGLPIVWPEPTHAKPTRKDLNRGWMTPKRLKLHRTAADCIDWSIPCPSIFERSKPLADATLRRVAKGVMRYVIDSGDPFIVPIAHFNGSNPSHDINEPLRTITAHPKGGSFALAVPTLVQTGYGERKGQEPRALNLHAPLGTIVSSQKHAVVAAFLAKHFTGVVGSDLREPIGTVTSVDHHSLVTASMVKFNTGAVGFRLDEPMHTITAGGQQARPGTACTMGVVTSNLVKLRNNCVGQDVREPLHTITSGSGHFAEVRAFLLSYYGSETGSDSIDEPLRTVTSRERFGLVTIKGQDYQIVDIGLRMLSPRELFRAQGFPENYIIGDDPSQGLTLPKYAQVRMCGNSVSPPVAEALVRANFKHEEKIYGRVAA